MINKIFVCQPTYVNITLNVFLPNFKFNLVILSTRDLVLQKLFPSIRKKISERKKDDVKFTPIEI